jgi:membrane fusion protein, multidrug efflux system
MSQTSLKDERPRADERSPAVRRKDDAGVETGERQPVNPPPKQRNILRRHPFVAAMIVLALIAAIAGGVVWWLNARNFESTDDAFIDARSVTISPQVIGPITKVAVTDNQLVDTGALLVQLGVGTYQAAVAQAEAQVAQANATVANIDAQVTAQKARIEQADKQVAQTEAALTFAQQENARFQDLLRRNAGTPQQAQQGASNLRQAEANLGAAQANATVTKLQIPVLQTQRQSATAQISQAEATLAQANINLRRTSILAPEPGRATKISAALGATAQVGQILMIFVPERKWVTANFKETELTLMRPGQPVDIAIDAYPGRVFRGHVDSIEAGTGAAFSLLPPENATGNFVKVVQRVPVKITFDTVPDVYIGPGMSVVPTVKVR